MENTIVEVNSDDAFEEFDGDKTTEKRETTGGTVVIKKEKLMEAEEQRLKGEKENQVSTAKRDKNGPTKIGKDGRKN